MSTMTMTHQMAAVPTRELPPLQLTDRGRWVVAVLLLAVVLGLSLLFSSGSVATDDRGIAPATSAVVVAEGDTLWGIASAVAAPGETREMMYRIERLNQLDTTMLVEGQTLLVPAS